MDNKQKKEKFIQDEVEGFMSKRLSPEKIDISCHDFLMEMVPSGKLYRYQRFVDYNLGNLKKHILYCSNPLFFNDPFDCRIGTDPREYTLSSTCYKLKIVYDILQKCYEINIMEKEIQCQKDESRLYKKWSQNEKIMDFVEKCARVPHDQFEDVVHAYKETFMKAVHDVSELKSIRQKNLNLTDVLFSSIHSFDVEDPMSRALVLPGVENTKNGYMHSHFNIVLPLACKFGITCFSTQYTNRLMWSHYADGHKGFCVEYDFSDLSYREGLPLPVIYSQKRPTMPWDALYRRSKEDFEEIEYAYTKALLTKDDIWEYEDEWRLFVNRNLTMEQMQDVELIKGLTIPAPPVSHIYLGALCAKEDYEKIKEIADEQNIPLTRLGVDPVEFKLNETNDFSIYENIKM